MNRITALTFSFWLLNSSAIKEPRDSHSYSPKYLQIACGFVLTLTINVHGLLSRTSQRFEKSSPGSPGAFGTYGLTLGVGRTTCRGKGFDLREEGFFFGGIVAMNLINEQPYSVARNPRSNAMESGGGSIMKAGMFSVYFAMLVLGRMSVSSSTFINCLMFS